MKKLGFAQTFSEAGPLSLDDITPLRGVRSAGVDAGSTMGNLQSLDTEVEKITHFPGDFASNENQLL